MDANFITIPGIVDLSSDRRSENETATFLSDGGNNSA
jgi:hypothetical protein